MPRLHILINSIKPGTSTAESVGEDLLLTDASAFSPPRCARPRTARVAMALSALSGDEQGILFVQLCNVLDPGIAVALSSVRHEATEPIRY